MPPPQPRTLRPVTSHPHALRNTLAYAVPEIFWGFAWALTMEGPMVAAFGDGFGGSEAYVGTVSLVGAFAIGIPMLFTAFWVEPMRHKRGFVFWGHVAGAVVLGLVALLIRWAGPSGAEASRLAYLVGVGLFWLSVGILVPAWLALVGELFPPGMRARVMGITFVGNRLGALAGGAVARAVLASGRSQTDQWTLLFALACGLSLVGSLPFLWVVETVRPRPVRESLGRYLRGLGRAFKELRGLRRFIAADMLGITTFVTIFFYGDAAFRQDGFDKSWAGIWVMCTAAAQMATSALVAWRGSRTPPRTWLVGAACVTAGGAVGAAIGEHVVAYTAAAIAGGVYFGVRMSCHAPQVMDLAPGRDGTAPLGIALAFAVLMQGSAPFVAGLLIPSTGYTPVFATVALICTVSAGFLLLWLPGRTGNPVTGEMMG